MQKQATAAIEYSWRQFLCAIIPALLLAATALGATDGAKSPERVLVAATAATPPAIDGKLDDPCWKNAESTCPFDVLPTAHPTLAGLFLQPDRKFIENAATAQVCYDDKNLYVAFHVPVPAGMQPKADAKGHDSQVWSDDCVELFLDPLSSGGYYQMMANASDAFADWSAAPGSGATSTWTSKALVKSRRDEKGFYVEMAIPFASLDAPDHSQGIAWKVNFTRSGYTAGGRSTWAPVGGVFASPSQFGALIFGNRKAYWMRTLAGIETKLASLSVKGQESAKADVGKKLAELKQKIEREGDQLQAWDSIRVSFDAVERDMGRIAVNGRAYIFWQKDIYGSISPSEKIGADIVVMEQLRMQAAQNMRAQSGFLISNLKDKSLLGRFNVLKPKKTDPAPKDGSRILDGARMRLLRGLYLEQQGGAMIPDALIPLRYYHLLEVPAGGTVLMWVEVDTHNLEPGRYTKNIDFLPSYSGFEPSSFQLVVDVAPVDLAKPYVPAFVYSSDINSGRFPLVAEDMVRHGVTTIYCIPETGQNSATFDANGNMLSNNWSGLEQTIDTMIAKAGGDPKNMDVLVFLCWGETWYRNMGVGGANQFAFGTEKWKRAFASYMTTLRDVIMKRGFGYDRIAFKTVDEPYGDPSDPKTSGSIAVRGARYIKEVDPKLRTMCNLSVDVKNAKYLGAYLDVYDIIQPYLGQLQSNPVALDELRRSGKELWGYDISGRDTSPGAYRDLWWYCAKNGFAGGNGFWSYCFFSGDPFNSYDLQGGYAGMTADYGVAYYMSGAAEKFFDNADRELPISSRRWEAWYQGVLDFRTIAVCRELIAGLKAAGKTDVAKVYDDKLTEIIQKTQGKSCLAMDQARESLLRMAVELQGGGVATP